MGPNILPAIVITPVKKTNVSGEIYRIPFKNQQRKIRLPFLIFMIADLRVI